MKALIYQKEDGLRLSADYPIPTRAAGESRIRVLTAAICNTDREILRGYKPDFSGVLGHEFVGVVEESDRPELVGKRVVGELNEGCGACLYCKTGREHHCDTRRVIGMSGRDGAFAQYLVMATRLLHPVPENVLTGQAVYTEPLAAALRIAEQVHLSPDKNVAVVGDGRLAFIIVQALSLFGSEITVFGKHPEKLSLFAPFANTATTLSGSFETVVDAAGGPGGLAAATRLVRREGTIILKSTYAGMAQADMSYYVVNEIKLVGSRCGPFAPALRLLARGLVCLPEVTLYPLEEYERAFADREHFKTGFFISAT